MSVPSWGKLTAPTGSTILIVGQNTSLAASVESHLLAEGYGVINAPSHASALSVLLQQVGALLVMWDLPRQNDYAFLADVRRSRPGLPVIVVSAYADPDVYCRAIEGGALSFVAKPSRMRDLIEELRGALQAAEVGGES